MGLDQLYSKFLDGRTIRHPTLGLELKQTQFGWSVGGSLEKKDESLLPIDAHLKIFTSLITNTTEPTDEPEGEEEAHIQNSMSRLFSTEKEEIDGETKLSDEKNMHWSNL